jgi:hypothetical protein
MARVAFSLPQVFTGFMLIATSFPISKTLSWRRSFMVKKVLGLTALVLLVSVAFAASNSGGPQAPPKVLTTVGQAGPAAPVGTEEPCISNPCVFYAGDFDPAGPNPNGLWNANNTVIGITGSTWVPVTVPKKYKGAKGKSDWTVTGLFFNEQMFDSTGGGYAVSSADWAIVQGVASGGNPTTVTTICSGSGATPALAPTGRIFGYFIEYTILITGISCPNLEAGTYWLYMLPTTPDLAYLSDVEDSTPANQEGPGTEPADDSFFYGPIFGASSFQNTTVQCANVGCDKFSTGVVGMTSH